MIVNSDFRRDGRVQKESFALAAAGYAVTVFALNTCRPEDEQWAGVRVVNPLSGSLAWFPYKPGYLAVYRQLLSALRREKCDVWHAHDLDVLPFAFVAAKLQGSRLVYDAHEYWQDYDWPGYGGRVSFVRRLLWAAWRRLERRLAGRCDLIITVSEGITRLMAQEFRMPVPLLVRNCVDPVSPAYAGPRLRRVLNLSADVPLVVYTGRLLKGRGLGNLVRALAGLLEMHLALVGEGPMASVLAELAEDMGAAGRVHFVPPVSPLTVPGLISDASLGAALIEDVSLSKRYSLPTKLFEYVAAGLPLLVTGLPEMAALVRRHGMGLVLDDTGPERIKTALEGLLAEPGRLAQLKAGSIRAGRELNWRNEVSLLTHAYAEMAGKPA
jgi:glycosyltransferase involved in cell wall biosynthesis